MMALAEVARIIVRVCAALRQGHDVIDLCGERCHSLGRAPFTKPMSASEPTLALLNTTSSAKAFGHRFRIHSLNIGQTSPSGSAARIAVSAIRKQVSSFRTGSGTPRR
jgi:hypothetical protein